MALNCSTMMACDAERLIPYARDMMSAYDSEGRPQAQSALCRACFKTPCLGGWGLPIAGMAW